MRRKYQLYGKNRKVFLDGLQKYWDRGVVIRVDGKVADASEWMKILEIQADGSFYMGDYIMEEAALQQPLSMVCENEDAYKAGEAEVVEEEQKGEDGASGQGQYYMGVLKEIRFDRVYNR